MEIKTATALAVAALGLALGPAPAAAQSQGIITCQITLGQFAQDAVAARDRLTTTEADTIAKLVDVSHGQCRSSPQLVMTNIRAARTMMELPTTQQARMGFDNSWSTDSQEVAELLR